MNTPQRLLNRFVAFSSVGKVQVDKDTPLDDADIDKRHKCEIVMEDVIVRTPIYDCNNRDKVVETIRTRAKRVTFNYTEVDDAILAFHYANFFSAADAPTGSQVNEVQSLAVAGAGKVTASLEGRTVISKEIPALATAADVQRILTGASMIFIQPGDLVVTGASSPFTLTFPDTGRLGRANLPLMVGDGGLTVSATTNGVQLLHAMYRSADDVKKRISFALGWDNVEDRVEKYSGFACDSVTPTLNRRQPVQFSASYIGAWEPEIRTEYDIPACVTIKPMMTEDCRLLVNGNWETSDINTLTFPLNDNIPTDESSAYGFDEVDIQDLERADQPTYSLTASIFGSEVDALYTLAQNERTQDPVDVKLHLGMPGHRVSLLVPEGKVKFQNTPLGNAGTLRKSVIQIEIDPFKDGVNAPVKADVYTGQTETFLDS